jgi:hypothetical protein
MICAALIRKKRWQRGQMMNRPPCGSFSTSLILIQYPPRGSFSTSLILIQSTTLILIQSGLNENAAQVRFSGRFNLLGVDLQPLTTLMVCRNLQFAEQKLFAQFCTLIHFLCSSEPWRTKQAGTLEMAERGAAGNVKRSRRAHSGDAWGQDSCSNRSIRSS